MSADILRFPPFTPIVAGLPATIPFVGPETLERQRGEIFRARIGANESAFGISPKASEAIREAIANIAWYADPEGHELREALAARHGLTMEEVCLGAGIDELLGLVVRMVVSPGTPVVTSLGAYPTFNYHVAGFGGVLHAVPYRDDCEDLSALAEEVRNTGAPLVYLANPDNPMGTCHDAGALRSFFAALPETTLIVVDEAYVQFAPEGVDFTVDTGDPRIVRMRTFSKAYGMAGARIGYALAARDVIGGLNRIRNHFGVNRLAQAGALASLDDDPFLAHVIAAVDAGRREYYELARRLNLACVPSATNFVTIDVGGVERARALLSQLQDRNIFIRMPGVAPLNRCVRITVGTPEERAVFAQAFEQLVDG
ncbi:MAG: pyridoxal phosphate-dependent aminotransferase [Gammaproteobacteria bacterium]